jgi:amino acid transporter
MTGNAPKTLTVWQVAALGIGSMVGAGVFALLGQVALLMGGHTWLAFAVGGGVALLSGYSYARLGARYPGAGGIIDYFRVGLPSLWLARTLGILYLLTLALTVAMVAKAFGAYGARLLHEPPTPLERVDTYASLVIVVLAAVNFAGSALVGRAELLMVVVKLAILALLIGVGAATLRPAMLADASTVAFGPLLSSVGLAFFAYAGYGMMANAAADVLRPERTIPRAFALAIGVVAVLYVVLALVVLGNVTPAQLARYADTAVAEAAQPLLGHAGFVLVSVAALLATASAINATIFSALKIAESMGEGGGLPKMFAHRVIRQGTVGMLWTVGAVLLITNLLPLGALASVASATFLICYLAVFVAAWRQRREARAAAVPLLLGVVSMLVVLGAFLLSLIQSQPVALALVAGSVLLAAGLAWTRRDAPTTGAPLR